VIADEVRQRDKNIGYNAVTAEYVDMFKAGVIDPAKVVKNALRNAASIAGLMLTTQVLVTRTDDVSGGTPKAAVEGAVK
jgi:chaperonin GroEL